MRTRTIVIAAAAVLAIAASAAAVVQLTSGDAAARQGAAGAGGRAGASWGGGTGAAAAGGMGASSSGHVASDPSVPLTKDEAEGLMFMREEEKLAHDIYTLLGQRYDLRAFASIARSESRHMDAVKQLLDAYSLDDPVASEAAGSFTDPELAALYQQLADRGEASLAEALRVAVAIEERDIADLEERMAATDRADLDAVYANLLRASEQHLRAFTAQLERS